MHFLADGAEGGGGRAAALFFADMQQQGKDEIEIARFLGDMLAVVAVNGLSQLRRLFEQVLLQTGGGLPLIPRAAALRAQDLDYGFKLLKELDRLRRFRFSRVLIS